MSRVTREKKKRKLEQLRRGPCRKCKVSAMCLIRNPNSIYHYTCRYCGRTWVTFEESPAGVYSPDWIELRACALPNPVPDPDSKPDTICNQIECHRKLAEEIRQWERMEELRKAAPRKGRPVYRSPPGGGERGSRKRYGFSKSMQKQERVR